MFAVDDIDDTVARLQMHGAKLLGDIVNYENLYRLCYLRGPVGIIVAFPGGPAVSGCEWLHSFTRADNLRSLYRYS